MCSFTLAVSFSQILLQEFDTRKPQYEQLTAAGRGILHRPGEHPSSHGMVKEQLAAVTQKWDSLTGQLRDRCDRIDQAVGKSTQYQSLLRSLSEKLASLDDQLSSSVAGGAHPDAMSQQLETAQKLQWAVEQEGTRIRAAQALCEDLAALVQEEYLRAELSRQLDGVLKSFKDLEQKAGLYVFCECMYVRESRIRERSCCRGNQVPTENLPTVRSACEEAVSGTRRAGPGQWAYGVGVGSVQIQGDRYRVGAGRHTAGPGKSQVPSIAFHKLTDRIDLRPPRGEG